MRVWFIAIFFALLLWQPASAQQVLTEQEFGDAAVAMLRARAPEAELERRDALSVTVRRPNNEIPELTVNLDNAYAEYRRNPAALTDVLDRFVRFAVDPRENAQMRERIVSVLRPRAMIDQYQAQAAQLGATDGPPSELVWRPFAGDLVEVIVFDGAETIQYAMIPMLEEINVSPEEAWAIAPTNLPARLGELEVQGVTGTTHLIYLTGGNGLAPSPLADPRFCATESGNQFIILIVDRNGYIVGDRTKSAAMAEFRAFYQEALRSGDSMSFSTIACVGGQMRAVELTD